MEPGYSQTYKSVGQSVRASFLGAKAPLELAHVKKKNNGTEKFGIALLCLCGPR